MAFILALTISNYTYGALRKIAVALNEDGAATPSSNPAEQHISNGAMLALNGLRPSKLTWINHGQSAAQTLNAIEEINKQKPAIVVGMVDSYQAILCAERMNPNSFLFSPVASSDEILKRDNVLVLGNVNSVQSQFVVQELKSRGKLTDRIVVAEILACPNCQNMSTFLVKDLREAGFQNVETHPIHASDVVNLGAKKAPEGFQHVIVPAEAAVAASVIRYFHAQNPKAWYWGSSTWGSHAKEIRELPFAKELRGVWVSHYHPDVPTEANTKFVTDFRAKFTAEPTDTAALFFEGVQLSMIVGQGNKPIPQVLKEVRAYKGLTGTVRIDGKKVIRDMVVMELQSGNAKFSKLVKQE